MTHLLENLLIFGRVLRHAGIDVHPGRLLDVVDALGQVDLRSREDVYHACRALLVHRHDQLAVFDRAFEAFWCRHGEGSHRTAGPGVEPGRSARATDDTLRPDALSAIAAGGDEEAGTEPPGRSLKTWSEVGGLADKDFAAYSAEEIVEAQKVLAGLAWSPGERRTHRWVPGRGSRIDLRRAIADSLRTGGEVVKLARRTRRIRPRPVVLLCDVSGSMERYSRMLLHFAHALTSRHHRVEAFLFSTQLTRITRQLRLPRPNDALTAVTKAVPDWSGGTRIGRAVREFHQRWGRRVLNGGPVVLLISDGWDCGDPEELRSQIERLQRSCHRLVWLNPLIGTADYAPLTRGLRASLPYVDDFLPARTLGNLADLAKALSGLAPGPLPARAR